MDIYDRKARRWARNNLIRKANRNYVLCEALRRIYDEIHEQEDKEKITELLVDCLIMAKNMTDRLHYYKNTYNDTTGKSGRGHRVLEDRRERKTERLKREI